VSAFHAILLVNDQVNRKGHATLTITPIAVEAFGHPRLRGFALIAVLTSRLLTRFLDVLSQKMIGSVVLRSDDARHGLDRSNEI